MQAKTKYQEAKNTLKNVAAYVKKQHPTDKPMIRQSINDAVDFLCKENNFSDTQRNLLSSYSCKLHPKN